MAIDLLGRLSFYLVVSVNIKGIQQCIRNTRGIRIVHSLTLIELTKGIHFVRGQFEVKDLGVRLDPGFMDGLRKDNYAQLVFVAQDDLAHVLVVLLGQVVQNWFSEEVLVTLAQWGPGFEGDVAIS